MKARLEALETGAKGEARVAEALVAEGWTVLCRNWRGGGSELDLVVVRDRCLRFVEVKARAEGDPVGLECVGAVKRAHLVRAARAWLLSHDEEFAELAFLIALVEPSGITWLDDAFDVE